MAECQQSVNDQKRTVGTINNKNLKAVTFDDSKTWLSATFAGDFAPTIEPYNKASFTLLPNDSYVCKGAVKYSGMSPDGGPVAVIVAWSASVASSVPQNKIYVVGGTKTYVDTITWDKVEDSLEKSTSTVGSSYGINANIKYEPQDKAVVVADILFT